MRGDGEESSVQASQRAPGVGIAELAAITPMSYGCFMPLSAPLHKLKTNWASEIPNWKRITLLGYSFSRCDSGD